MDTKQRTEQERKQKIADVTLRWYEHYHKHCQKPQHCLSYGEVTKFKGFVESLMIVELDETAHPEQLKLAEDYEAAMADQFVWRLLGRRFPESTYGIKLGRYAKIALSLLARSPGELVMLITYLALRENELASPSFEGPITVDVNRLLTHLPHGILAPEHSEVAWNIQKINVPGQSDNAIDLVSPTAFRTLKSFS